MAAPQGNSAGFLDEAPFRAAIMRLAQALPPGVNLDDDVWDVSAFYRGAGKRKLTFSRVGNPRLRLLCKLGCLDARLAKDVGFAALVTRAKVYFYIDASLGERSPETLTSEDFYIAENIIRSDPTVNRGHADRLSAQLQETARWIQRFLGLRIEYKCRGSRSPDHGRFGTETGRHQKLLPDEIIGDLIALRHRTDLELRDQFYLSALAIAVAGGFRINELMTLPADCIIDDEGLLRLRNFSTKGGKLAPRPVPPSFELMVKEAVGALKRITEPARELARQISLRPALDWRRVFAEASETELEGLVRGWAAEWTSVPHRRMTDLTLGYLPSKDRWFDVFSAIEATGSQSGAARVLGLSRPSIPALIDQVKASRRGEIYCGKRRGLTPKAFETDPRVCSVRAFATSTGIDVRMMGRMHRIVQKVVDEAAQAQLAQAVFSSEAHDAEVVGLFSAHCPIVLRDHRSGKVLLAAEDALMVVRENELTIHKTLEDRIQVVTSNMLSRWLAGEARARGTGGREDSVCARFDVRDPRTLEVAKPTIHDIRHWLNTAYDEGGLTQDQIAIIFNRNNTAANATYQQTSSTTRAARLRDATRAGIVIGHQAETYNALAQENPLDAEKYLQAAIKIYNPMPHGICTLDLAAMPCPHSLSCFSCNHGNEAANSPCEHLIVDLTDKGQREGIERIHRNATALISVLEQDDMKSSPQYAHFQEVEASTSKILGLVR